MFFEFFFFACMRNRSVVFCSWKDWGGFGFFSLHELYVYEFPLRCDGRLGRRGCVEGGVGDALFVWTGGGVYLSTVTDLGDGVDRL